jgi:hypothetical protein
MTMWTDCEASLEPLGACQTPKITLRARPCWTTWLNGVNGAVAR